MYRSGIAAAFANGLGRDVHLQPVAFRKARAAHVVRNAIHLDLHQKVEGGERCVVRGQKIGDEAGHSYGISFSRISAPVCTRRTVRNARGREGATRSSTMKRPWSMLSCVLTDAPV